jgi:8-oxo-dGTP pyrophosphatase MutT (NUDIX family)
MANVAKLLFIDKDDKYLMMYRSPRPTFGDNDPDLPGGTVDGDEELIDALVREVDEEIQVQIDKSKAELIYSGDDYSTNGSQYALYTIRVDERPKITMSWEHSSYEWIDRDDFIRISAGAMDTYMHMVAGVLKNQPKY